MQSRIKNSPNESICVCVYIYIYIYMRERERERERVFTFLCEQNLDQIEEKIAKFRVNKMGEKELRQKENKETLEEV